MLNYCVSNSLFTVILCNLYFGRLRLVRISDVEENSGPRASRRSYRVVYANIRGLHENLLELSLITRGRDVFHVPKLLSLSCPTFLSLWFTVEQD